MLASSNRLKKSRDISRVFKRGHYTAEGPLVVKVDRSGQDQSRVVVVVSKKISKKAVVRNRIRRQISGILERRWQTVAQGYDIVVTVRQDTSDLTPAALEKVVVSVLTKVGVMATTIK